MEPVKFDIVYWGEDWVALYQDGIKVYEGHSLNGRDVLEILGYEVKTEDFNSPDELLMWDGPPYLFEDIEF